MHLLTSERSPFNTLRVCDTTELYGELGKFRVLQFADGAVQGAIDLRAPSRVVLPYQRAMIRLMDTIRPSFDRAFVIGHGAGTLARHYRDRRIDVAELDERVVALSREYFGYMQDNVAVGDGRALLAQAGAGSLDYIVVDAFTSEGTPPHLATLEFYEMAGGKLRTGGAMLINVIGRGRGDKRVASMLATLEAAFASTTALAHRTQDREDGANLILVAGAGGIADASLPPDFEPIRLERGYVLHDRAAGEPEDSGRSQE
ncbi:spermidine synthase [Cohnella sp. 56]|uniref:spermidine synthase n=1 Tax=Cohnella sp. 56 TaxID=3113722 RepID=UPI0030E8A929